MEILKIDIEVCDRFLDCYKVLVDRSQEQITYYSCLASEEPEVQEVTETLCTGYIYIRSKLSRTYSSQSSRCFVAPLAPY
jgi:hypothetical protein